MREKILAIIEKNSRIDLKDLAALLGESEAAVANEIAEMEKENIICGYHTLINWDNTSEEKVAALIEVKVTPQRGMGFDKIAERKLDKEEIDGVGIGVPGPVNERGEVPCAVNLFWGFKEVTKELTELTGLPSKAGNDANVAALGEAWKGAAAGAKNVILVTLGTGVGGGIIVDGKIVGGAHGAGGEIGHAAVDHEEKEACNCGNCGCLEQYASATGIVRVAQRTLAATDEQTVLRKFTKLSAKNVLDAFKEGDKVACDVMAQVGEMLGGTLAMFACVTDPEAIVIGGGVSKAGQPLIDCIQKYYEKYAFTACKKTPIILATLGNDAGIYGSARMVIKEV